MSPVNSSERSISLRDHTLLHVVVIVWGITAVLGKGIELPSTVLVAWRTGLAAVGMLLWLLWRGQKLWPGKRAVGRFLLVGSLIGFHWYLFFLAGKLGPVSISLVGVATCSLWCALLEPLLHKEKKLQPVELIFGALVVVGAVIIGFGDPVSLPCLLTGVAAAFVAAIFSFMNNALVKQYDHTVITLYEMVGASCFMLVCAGVSGPERWMPKAQEWFWLILLSQICTVWAFSVYIGLLRRVSVYQVSLTSNLEPVWGILLAGVLLGEYSELKGSFWIGGIVVLACIAAYPVWLKYLRNRTSG